MPVSTMEIPWRVATPSDPASEVDSSLIHVANMGNMPINHTNTDETEYAELTILVYENGMLELMYEWSDNWNTQWDPPEDYTVYYCIQLATARAAQVYAEVVVAQLATINPTRWSTLGFTRVDV